MKLIMKPIRIISLLIFTSLQFGASYYVDFTGGADTNDGLSSGSAWKNASKVESSSFSAGDQILFKRGERWDISSEFDVPSSGSAGNPIVIDAYGSGAKPIIDCINVISGSTTAGNWTDTGGNVWTMSLATNPKRVWFDGTEVAAADTTDHTISSTYAWRWASSTLYIYSASGNPATVPIDLQGIGDCNQLFDFNGKSYVTVRNLDLRGGATNTVGSRGPTGHVLEHNNIGYGGYGLVALNQVAGCTSDNSYGVIRFNIFDQGFRLPTTGYDDMSGVADGISLREGTLGWEIYGNTIKNYIHTGFVAQATSAGCNASRNHKFYNNDVHSADTFDGRGFEFKCTDNMCYNNQIFANRFHDFYTASKLDGNNNYVGYNLFYDNSCPTYDTPCPANISAFVIFISLASDQVSYGNALENNVFYNNDAPCVVIDQQSSPSMTKYGHVIRNNIFMDCGNDATTPSLANVVLTYEYGTNVGANTIQNNIAYDSGSATTIWRYNTTNYSATNFNALNGSTPGSGSDTIVISGNSTANPLFVSAGSDFNLTSSSPAINAGATNTFPIDFDFSQSRKDSTAPDQGAHEYGGHITIRGASSITGVKTA